MPVPTALDFDVWVVSPGGVGTTFLMEYISRYAETNNAYDADGWKHWPIPPTGKALENAPNIIFVHGEPSEIVSSISRRGWIRTQSVNLLSVGGIMLKGDQQKQSFKLAVERQIDAWTQIDSNKVFAIRYDDLWDKSSDIALHIGADVEKFVSNFPSRKARKSTGSLYTTT